MKTAKKKPENPNDHKRKTPGTKGRKDSKAYTSYDTSKSETSTPQKVKEGNESAGQQERSDEAEKS